MGKYRESRVQVQVQVQVRACTSRVYRTVAQGTGAVQHSTVQYSTINVKLLL